MNGIGPASLTTWLMNGLTPGNIDQTLRHVATGWLALSSAEAVCVWWQPRPYEPSFAFARSRDGSSLAEQSPVDDGNFAPILAWAADITKSPIESFVPQMEADSPVRYCVFACGSDQENTPPELEPATRSILARLETEAMIAERLRNSKLEAMAEFAAGAGHEINNPVATIVGRANLLLAEESDLDRRASLATVGAQALRIRDMIGDTMLFARPPQPHFQPLDLAVVIPGIVAPYEAHFRSKNVQFTCNAVPSITISADRTQFAVAISALLQNALEAVSTDETVEVTVRSEGGTIVRICITDSGMGLSETERIHLFDPFYSGRQAGRGLGFGLPKAWRIVMQHGGRIAVEDGESGGCRFVVDWPTIVK